MLKFKILTKLLYFPNGLWSTRSCHTYILFHYKPILNYMNETDLGSFITALNIPEIIMSTWKCFLLSISIPLM